MPVVGKAHSRAAVARWSVGSLRGASRLHSSSCTSSMSDEARDYKSSIQIFLSSQDVAVYERETYFPQLGRWTSLQEAVLRPEWLGPDRISCQSRLHQRRRSRLVSAVRSRLTFDQRNEVRARGAIGSSPTRMCTLIRSRARKERAMPSATAIRTVLTVFRGGCLSRFDLMLRIACIELRNDQQRGLVVVAESSPIETTWTSLGSPDLECRRTPLGRYLRNMADVPFFTHLRRSTPASTAGRLSPFTPSTAATKRGNAHLLAFQIPLPIDSMRRIADSCMGSSISRLDRAMGVFVSSPVCNAASAANPAMRNSLQKLVDSSRV